MIKKQKKQRWEQLMLKIILLVYIVLCIAIAGLNYGIDSEKYPEIHSLVVRIWHFYENPFKTFLIILGSILTLRIKGGKSKEQRKNLAGFICSALVIHIISPLVLSNPDAYFFAMAPPWSSTALQLMSESSGFYQNHFPLWGTAGISAVLLFYAVVSLVTYLGTLLLGRRWQCSTICLFNGFISESFSPAFPVFGNRKTPDRKAVKAFGVLKAVMLIIAAAFTVYWLAAILFGLGTESALLIGSLEVYKYLTVELLAAMFFWVAFTGRGYCYYCPLGTVLGWIGKKSGQMIVTDKTGCIDCGKCDTVCPMNISISSYAVKSEAVVHGDCVGCRHCVDACPKNTLEYTTRFLSWKRNLKTGGA